MRKRGELAGQLGGAVRQEEWPGCRLGQRRPIIALDARKLARPNVGIAQYVYEVARRLPELAPEMDFVLLADSPIPVWRRPAGCRVVALGVQVRSRSLAKVSSPFWMHVAVPRYLNQAGVDLFHGTNFAVPFRGRGRFVSTVHDMAYKRVPDAWTFWYRNYLAASVRVSLRRASEVIVGSASAANDLVELTGFPQRFVVVAHYGVGDEFRHVGDQREVGRVRSKYNLPDRFLLHVGTIERRKNLVGLVRAINPLFGEGVVDALVLVGGRGYDSSSVDRAVVESGSSQRVLFLGHVVQEDLAVLYSMAVAAAFPSWYEGFGLPVLEAMACGTPVVVSNVSSLPEVAGDAALMIRPSDVGDMTDTLRRVMTDAKLRECLRRRGMERASMFTWEAAAAKHVEVYRRVLDARR